MALESGFVEEREPQAQYLLQEHKENHGATLGLNPPLKMLEVVVGAVLRRLVLQRPEGAEDMELPVEPEFSTPQGILEASVALPLDLLI